MRSIHHKLLATVTLLLTLISTCQALDSLNVNRIGQILLSHGQVRDITVHGNYAYLATEVGLEVLDISDLNNPVLVGYSLSHAPGDFIATNGLVVVTASYWAHRLNVYDVSVPTNPILTGSIQDSCLGICLRGNYLYVAALSAGLKIYNISRPGHPPLVGVYNSPGTCLDVDIYESLIPEYVLACLADAAGGLKVVDVSNPASPFLVNSYMSTPNVTRVSVDSIYAYISTYVSSENHTVSVIDLSNHNLPSVGSYTLGDYITDITADHGYVYLARDWDGFSVLDFRNLSSPELMATFDFDNQTKNSFAISRNDIAYCLVANWYAGLAVVEVPEGSPPNIVGTFDPTALDIVADSNYAYLACSASGLVIVDVQIPSQPVQVASCSFLGRASALVKRDSLVYVAACEAGLCIVDVSDPTVPVEIGHLITQYGAYELDVEGHYAYITHYSDGMSIVDIEDPQNPTLTGYVDIPSYVGRLDVVDTLAYISRGINGIRIFNVSNPTAPMQIYQGTYHMANDIKVIGSCLYSVGYDVIDAYDVANPYFPHRIDHLSIYPAVAIRLTISENKAYIAALYDGLRIVDISHPNTLSLWGYFMGEDNTYPHVNSIAVSGSYIYTAEKYFFGSYQCTNIDEPALSNFVESPPELNVSAPSPNPFNANTTVKYTLAHAGDVHFSLFDISGRIVKEEMTSGQNAGTHEITIDGSNLGSGVYFAHLQAGDLTSLQKIVLLK